MTDFRIGQKVVCVDVNTYTSPRGWLPSERPRLNGVYTIVGFAPIHPYYASRVDGEQLILDELRRDSKSVSEGLVGYWSKRFRPLDEDRYSIEIFTAMCKPKQRIGAK